MAKKKDMAGEYEILHSIRLGGRLMLMGYNPKDAKAPYMTCYQQPNLLGDTVYPEAIASNDYFEIMQTFLERLQTQAEKVKTFKASRNAPFGVMGIEDCRQRGSEESLEGKLIILRPSSLAAEYRTADCQLGIATGGFGCYPGASGRVVYFKELYSGDECRWDIGDVLGIADIDKLPAWAKEKLAEYKKKRTAPKKERGEAR